MNRFIIVQVGARRNYAVPSILEKADILEAFYTDLCADSGLGKLLSSYCPTFLRRGKVARLIRRELPRDISREKVRTFALPTLFYFARRHFAGSSYVRKNEATESFVREFSRGAIKTNTGNATHVYSMFGEGIEFLEFAKEKGIKIVTEVLISPITYKISQEESKRYPELEKPLSPELYRKHEAYAQRICKVSDHFIVPSQFVMSGLQQFGVTPDQCSLVPYAVDRSWLEVCNQPVRGRLLFVGTAGLRKGIHILGQAAQRLEHLNYEFRVAGGVSDDVKNHLMTSSLNFLGRVPRNQIQEEYAQADIFVLPSLAEGSAEVIYEALAVGLPVITTAAAGSVISDRVNGFIVKERDPTSLALCIEKVVEERELRNRISDAAKQTAHDYTWEKYSERLVQALKSI